MQVIEFARRLDAKIAAERLNLQNSLLISLLAGNSGVERGSTATASATTHSRATGDFLKLREWPAFSGITCGCLIFAMRQLGWEPVLALLSLASKSRCPATETGAGRDRFDLKPLRGAGKSPGRLDPNSPAEFRDFYDAIEWAGSQPWCNGKVGLTGISYHAAGQWRVTSMKPRYLAALLPWQGTYDFYADRTRQDGIFGSGFVRRWWTRSVLRNQHGNCRLYT